MRPHDPSFHGRDSRKSIRYLFTINCTCGNVFETARTSLMSLIGYARVSTAEGRQWQASTCLPPSSSTGTPPGWAKRSLGEDMPACPWSPSSCHTSRPSVGPTSCSPANTDGKNAELSLTCHFALFRNRPHKATTLSVGFCTVAIVTPPVQKPLGVGGCNTRCFHGFGHAITVCPKTIVYAHRDRTIHKKRVSRSGEQNMLE